MTESARDAETSNDPDPTRTDVVADVLSSRRTINNFKPSQPPRDLVLRAIDVARFAPNHHLTEPWHFYLISDETKIAIIELNTELVAARQGPEAAETKRQRWSQMPGWMVVTADRSDDPDRAREDYAAVCCAVHSMTLFLWSAGVGCKWTTGPVTRDARFFETLWIDPDREDVVGMIWYGYPDNIPDTARKSVDQIIVDI